MTKQEFIDRYSNQGRNLRMVERNKLSMPIHLELLLQNIKSEKQDSIALRDQFAMSAMSAIIIGVPNRKGETDDGEYFDYFYEHVMNDHGRSDYSMITEQAYEIADDMLKAREQ
jgi:hypothetical protein